MKQSTNSVYAQNMGINFSQESFFIENLFLRDLNNFKLDLDDELAMQIEKTLTIGHKEDRRYVQVTLGMSLKLSDVHATVAGEEFINIVAKNQFIFKNENPDTFTLAENMRILITHQTNIQLIDIVNSLLGNSMLEGHKISYED